MRKVIYIIIKEDRFSWTDLMKTKNLGFQFDDYVKLEYKLKHIEN